MTDDSGDLYLAPATHSDNRAALMGKPSEDASHLLCKIPLPEAAEQEMNSDDEEYLPHSAVSWIVCADLDEAQSAQQIADMFGKEWRQKYGGLTIYGKDVATDLWTFLISADGPTNVTALQFSWRYAPSWKNTDLAPASLYRQRLQSIEKQLSSLTKIALSCDVAPQEAAARSQVLENLTNDYDDHVVFSLTSKGPAYDGKLLWDVLTSLGLRWGDMDCFHWENPHDFGDSYYFSVQTSSHPGYFLPEDIASGVAKYEDLLFSFSLPRSPNPAAVYDVMATAITYAQQRLGGIIDFGELSKDQIEARAKGLAELGFPPGATQTLQQF